MSTDYERAIKAALDIQDKLERALYVVGVWTESLRSEGIRPIIVGGTAVEFYSFGAYMTYDIDLVCDGRAEALAKLGQLGFEQTDSLRHWYHETLGIVIEIPDERLAGSEEHVVEVQVGSFTAYVIGIEDLVLDRLRAYVHWRSTQDGEWARRLVQLHRESMDWPYLNETAKSEGLSDTLNGLIESEPGP